MNVQAVAARTLVGEKAETAGQEKIGNGASFLESVTGAVKDGKLIVPGGVGVEKMDFLRNKFGIDKVMTQDEAEKDLLYGFLAKIQRVLDKKNK